MSLRSKSSADLLEAARAGNVAALGRLLSIVEAGGEAASELGALVFPASGRAHTVGITGAPGAGKSTLTNVLVKGLRAGGARVAVLAIDPTSPYSGGAILGDRVRMAEHVADADVFIRSMATRGHLGGLTLATPQAVRVLDAAGFDWIVIETVGVGQIELAISETADTTVVVVNPGWGDEVQAAKAGLLEIADIFVINKADREGVEKTQKELEQMLDLRETRPAWQPPVLATVATRGSGAETVLEAICSHRKWAEQSGRLASRRSQLLWVEVQQIVSERLAADIRRQLAGGQHEKLRAALESRSLDPGSAARELIEEWRKA